MRSQSTIDTIRDRVTELTDEEHRQAALNEARRRLAGARHVIAEGAETLGDTAEERWTEARKATAPTVKAWRKRATKVANDIDTDALRRDARQLSVDVGSRLRDIGADLGDVTRHEADRIIASIHEAAEQARKDAEQAQRDLVNADRSRRNRRILGLTLVAAVAGMIVSARMGKSDPMPHADEIDLTTPISRIDPVKSDGPADTSPDEAEETTDAQRIDLEPETPLG